MRVAHTHTHVVGIERAGGEERARRKESHSETTFHSSEISILIRPISKSRRSPNFTLDQLKKFLEPPLRTVVYT